MEEKEPTMRPALDTLIGCSKKPPNEIQLTFKLVSTLQAMQNVMNSKWIGVVLYCVYCKEPLNYTYNNGKVLFQCPKCKVRWVKNSTWEGDSKDGASKLKGICTRISKE